MDALPGISLTEDEIIKTVRCPTCHRGPGGPCASRGGRLVPCHRSRYLAAKDYAYEHARLERWQQETKGGAK